MTRSTVKTVESTASGATKLVAVTYLDGADQVKVMCQHAVNEDGSSVDFATESTLGEVSSKLTTLTATIADSGDIATSLFTDDSGAYYVRRDVIDGGGITVTFTDSVGDPATPGVGLRPLSGTAKTTTYVMYNATNSGTGYSTGDILARVIISDLSVSPPTATPIWINTTTSTVISAPTAGHYIAVAKDIAVTSSALPTGAATAANQSTANALLSSIDSKMPDLSGTWGYASGTSGTPTLSGSKRILQITATAGASGATMTINGGGTITIPALSSITICPKANLVDPTIVMTNTVSYFVEHIT